jgi:hypothetical protein
MVFILAFPSPVDMYKGDFLTLSCFIEDSAAQACTTESSRYSWISTRPSL